MEPKPKKKNIDKKNKQLTESAVLIAVGLVFILIGSYLPILSIFVFFAAVPVIVITYRNGRGMGAVFGLIMALLLSILVHPVHSITMYLLFFIPGLAMGFHMTRRRDPFYVIFAGFLVMTGTLMAYLQVLNLFFDFNIVQQMQASITEYMEIQKEYLQGIPLNAQQLLASFHTMFPAFLLSFTLFLSFLNYFASVSLMRRLGEPRELGTLMEFSLPGNVPLILLLIYILMMLLKNTAYPYFEELQSNLLAVFGVLFFLQGIAVISYFMTYMKLSGLARIIVWGCLIFLAPISGFVPIVGLIDTAFNFRKLSRR